MSFDAVVRSEFKKLSPNYFNSPYFGPLPLRSQEAATKALETAANPVNFPYEEWRPLPDAGRNAIAQLLGVSADQVSHHGGVSEVTSYLSLGVAFKAEDTVVVMDGEYPSDVLPWMLNQKRSGYQLLKLNESAFTDLTELAASLPASTKILNISHVMFNTGRKNDILAIGQLCHKRGILFVVDVTQSLGGMQLTSEEVDVCDVIVGATYKWLLGPYGHAFAYWSKETLSRVQNTHLSWQTSSGSTPGNLLNYTVEALPGARRFDRGQAPNYLAMKTLLASLSLFNELGLDKIQSHNAHLVNQFLESYPKESYQLITPPPAMGNIVCLRSTAKADSEKLEKALREKKIYASVREGNLRLGFHLFNDENQVNALVQALN